MIESTKGHSDEPKVCECGVGGSTAGGHRGEPSDTPSLGIRDALQGHKPVVLDCRWSRIDEVDRSVRGDAECR